MSFYGNINTTNFVFDKIYESKAAMDAAASTDGVFIGRYVLVDYHKEGTNYNDNVLQDNYNYDSTVWQKNYSNEKEKYIMIAELNFDTPDFNLVIDPPTLNVKEPYSGSETVDRVSYYWHFQPQWGFQIKPQENYEFSDEEVSLVGKVWDYENQKFEEIMENKYYQGDIYYNKEGFNPEYRVEKEYNLNNDTIKLTPTGYSGNTFCGDEEVADTYELSIILPSIGNTISSIWDIVYGLGEKESQNSNKYIRNMDIEWDSIFGNRLVQGNSDGTGYTYNPYYIDSESKKQYQINTLSGCINSVHDLMGMIIDYEDPSKYNSFDEFKSKVLEKASTNRIYYGPYGENSNYNSFYMKYLSYEYQEKNKDQDVEIKLTDFTENEYFYKNNNNFYREYKTNNSGGTYYILENIKEEIFNENKYDANTYYYKDGEDYVLDGSSTPDSNKIYYKLNITTETEKVDNKKVFFFPTNQNYFDKFFKGQEIKNSGTGLFYEDLEHKGIYRHFILGETEFNENLKFYWIENYVIEESIDREGNIVTVYDFDKNSIKTLYTMIQFDSENNYYYYDNQNKRYNKLISESDIEENVTYYKFDEDVIEEIVEKFYWPNSGYYYKEKDNYILAKEDRKQNKTYYSFDYNEINNVTFYEPNKYYYKEGNTWILDESKTMTKDRQYYKHYPLYVESDSENIFPVGSQWNDTLDYEDFPSVVLKRKVEKYKWKELVGFSRDLNTLHGLLLEINNVLKIGDKDTRDTETVQGCINSINDLISKITKLSPSKILITDKYGRISEAKIQTDDWINLTVNDGVINISLSQALIDKIDLLL